MTDAKEAVLAAAKLAKNAAPALAIASTETKNKALKAIAQSLIDNLDQIISVNHTDLEKAKNDGVSDYLIDRLMLDEDRIRQISEAVLEVIDIPDPINTEIRSWTQPNGIRIEQVRVPIGVIAMIYEARPNVTVDSAALCLKSGNVAFLRGSSNGDATNELFVQLMRSAVVSAGLPADCIVKAPGTTHAAVEHILKARGLVDLVIPRGGAALIENVVTNSIIPVIETGIGNCHIYIDANCDVDMAVNLVVNSKTQRVSVCNAAETMLVHKDAANKVLPKLLEALKAKGVTLHADKQMAKFAKDAGINYADVLEEDWHTEYYSLDIAAGIVDSFDAALSHIRKYSTEHTELIITNDPVNAARFTNELDSAVLLVNASTRFTDGGEFGFGAEIGISTQKLHARGPMGLVELTSYKYIVTGDGQVRS